MTLTNRENELDVIVPFVNSRADLFDCLSALADQGDVGLRTIVVDRVGLEGDDEVFGLAVEILHVRVQSGTTIPEMRAIAIGEVNAPAVAQIEDHVIVPSGWARAMLNALADGHDVVGGAIENAATEKLVDRAAFLCEYSSLLPPLPAGVSMGLPGNNIVYRTEVLKRFMSVLTQNRWENVLHDTMRDGGIELIMRPDIIVGHKMHYTFGLYFSQRYHYSRSYAGSRFSGAGPVKRAVAGLASFALPPLLLLRIVRTVLAKGVRKAELITALPFLAIFVVAWGAGEIIGYWFGAGTSLAKVR